MTAIEWISSLQEAYPLEDMLEKVIFVQSRASEHELSEPERNSGLVYATVGPLLTLLNVRTTSQRNHNDAHLISLETLLNHQGVSFATVDFELSIDSPLSWHLTAVERDLIEAQWDELPAVRKSRDELECLWVHPPGDWVVECGVKPPIDLRAESASAEILRRAQSRSEDAATPVTLPMAL